MPPIAYFFCLLKLKLNFDLILGPSWVALGNFLEYFWVVLLHVRSRCDIDRFFIDFRTLEISKTLKIRWFFSIFAFALPSLLRSILLRTWSHFGLQNQPFGLQNRPKIFPKRVFKGVENHIGYLMPSRAFNNHFLPMWLQHGPILLPKMAPSWAQNRFKIAAGAEFASDLDLNRVWIDFGPIFG